MLPLFSIMTLCTCMFKTFTYIKQNFIIACIQFYSYIHLNQITSKEFKILTIAAAFYSSHNVLQCNLDTLLDK